MNITINDFYDMTPIELYNAMFYKNQMEVDTQNNIVKAIFESMRIHAWLNISASPYIKKKYRKPVDLLKFAWEKTKQVDQKSLKEQLLSWAKYHNKKIEQQEKRRKK